MERKWEEARRSRVERGGEEWRRGKGLRGEERKGEEARRGEEEGRGEEWRGNGRRLGGAGWRGEERRRRRGAGWRGEGRSGEERGGG